jgi:hypothetical protein
MIDTPATGQEPEIMQDSSRLFSQWLATRLGAKQLVRERVEKIREEKKLMEKHND